jgi:hypothetical protein
MDMSVKTISKCSLGGMSGPSNQAITSAFEACKGKKSCQMDIDFASMFDAHCNAEIGKRLSGKTFYGEPKIYAISHCVSEVIQTTNDLTSREDASLKIVLIDSIISLLFVLAIFRLKWYEDLFEKDR